MTDPDNFELVGVPPRDLVAAVAAALRQAHFDADDTFRRCKNVSNEWVGTFQIIGRVLASIDVFCNQEYRSETATFHQRHIRQQIVPMIHRELGAVLNPQPAAQRVYTRLLRLDICTSLARFCADMFVYVRVCARVHVQLCAHDPQVDRRCGRSSSPRT